MDGMGYKKTWEDMENFTQSCNSLAFEKKKLKLDMFSD